MFENKQLQAENGSSLIAMAIMTIVVGFMITGFLFIFQNQELINKDQETFKKSDVIAKAINDYVMRNGRLPCPAPLNAPRDSQFFGIEDPAQNCNSANYYATGASNFVTSRGIVSTAPLGICGTVPVTVLEGTPPTPVIVQQCNPTPNCRCNTIPPVPPGNIKIGTLPVRSLNLKDNYMVDGYGKRYVYAVTENLASPGVAPSFDLGAINIEDTNNNTLPTQRAHVKYIFFAPGAMDNGSYDIEGARIQPCDNTVPSGENCDYQIAGQADATFMSSFFKTF